MRKISWLLALALAAGCGVVRASAAPHPSDPESTTLRMDAAGQIVQAIKAQREADRVAAEKKTASGWACTPSPGWCEDDTHTWNCYSKDYPPCTRAVGALAPMVRVAATYNASCSANLGPGSACYRNYTSSSCNAFRAACCRAGYYCE